MKIVILTADETRHKYFVNQLVKHFAVGVLSEPKKKKSYNNIIMAHFNKRAETERRMLSAESFNVPVKECSVNSIEVFDWIVKLNPDVVVLYGCSLVKDPLLSGFKIVNMHLGLSPYYRGSGTNFFPFVDNKPECVGVTVHFVSKIIDGGGIIAQVRPSISKQDDCHIIGCNAIKSGTDLMIRCLKHLDSIQPVKQQISSSARKISDFNESVLLKMQNNFKQGMIGDYLKHKTERDKRYPLVELER